MESAELALRTILNAVKRAPIRLRNVLKILDQSAADLSGFCAAKAWLQKTVESRPELLLTQSEPPPEWKQPLQITPPAGGYEGPHYRRCPATGQWVLIPSKARRKEVDALKESQEKKTGSRWRKNDSEKECPFCIQKNRENNTLIARVAKGTLEYSKREALLPAPWATFADWSCYVIENRKPIYSPMKDKTQDPPRGGTGPFESIQGQGISDLIVIGCGEHPYEVCIEHEHLQAAFEAVHHRMEAITEDNPRIRHIAVFSNHRAEAGAHVSHLNWQLIASPIVPMGIARELGHGRLYFDEYFGRCCFCDMIQAERAHSDEVRSEGERDDRRGSRIVLDEKNFIVIAPYASGSPFEMWILPTEHESSIADMFRLHPDRKVELATILSRVLRQLRDKLGDPGYSMLIQNAPTPRENYESLHKHYHWRIIIETKDLVIPAGYEHLTGIWSNSVTPEAAARTLLLGTLPGTVPGGPLVTVPPTPAPGKIDRKPPKKTETRPKGKKRESRPGR